MDVLIAILTTGFKDSNWTDQEIGVAIGRDVLIIPIRRDLNPYGFIAKLQGLQGEGKSVGEVADGVFEILASHQKTKAAMAKVIVNLFLFEKNGEAAQHWLSLLERFDGIPSQQLERLHENAPNGEAVREYEDVLGRLNRLFRRHELTEVVPRIAEVPYDDDLPF
jgi:hypothetical protein